MIIINSIHKINNGFDLCFNFFTSIVNLMFWLKKNIVFYLNCERKNRESIDIIDFFFFNFHFNVLKNKNMFYYCLESTYR